jgi:hypothetical protein
MCIHCKAASAVLDMLWEEPQVRMEFHTLGVELRDLGPLTHELFVPAFLSVQENLDSNALNLLDAQITQDLLEPHYEQPHFREAWNSWGDDTRTGFLREQTEVKVAQLLMRFYADDFSYAYKTAYINYLALHRSKEKED